MSFVRHRIDLLVVVVRVMVEERQTLDATLSSHLDRIAMRAMTPMTALALFADGELGVVDEQVGTVDKLEHLGGNKLLRIVARTVIGDEGDHNTRRFHSISKGGVWVPNGLGRHSRARDRKGAGINIVKANVAS